VSAEELIARSRMRTAGFEVARTVGFREESRLTATGRVLKDQP
jgi:hypothetical protein